MKKIKSEAELKAHCKKHNRQAMVNSPTFPMDCYKGKKYLICVKEGSQRPPKGMVEVVVDNGIRGTFAVLKPILRDILVGLKDIADEPKDVECILGVVESGSFLVPEERATSLGGYIKDCIMPMMEGGTVPTITIPILIKASGKKEVWCETKMVPAEAICVDGVPPSAMSKVILVDDHIVIVEL